MHFAAGGAVLVIGAILMAAVFGYIFHKFDSLWICITAHASANLPDFILYDHPDISDNMLLGLKVFFACSFAAGIYGFSYTLSLINGKYKMTILYPLMQFGVVRLPSAENP